MDNEIVEEKKNNTNKILIAIIILLLLALGGLSYYTFFVKDKEIDKPNPVIESTNTSNSAKEADLKSTVQMVASAAEIQYQVAQTLGTTFPTAAGTPCGDWAEPTIGATSDYASCTYEIDSKGIATVRIKGTTTGKFANWSKANSTAGCSGTRSLVTCINNGSSVAEPTESPQPIEKKYYEVRNEGEGDYKYAFLYINGTKVKEENGNDLVSLDNMKVTEFNDLLIVEVLSTVYDSRTIAVDKNGKVINFNTLLYNKDELNYTYALYDENRIEEKNLYIKNKIVYSQGDLYAFCDHKPTDPYEYEVKFEYLGNGKFSDGVISKVTTIAEYDFEKNYNLKCSDRNN